MTIDSKLPHVGTTIFSVMSRLASETGAINLSQGFPSFEPPDALLTRFEHYLRHGANQYAPMPGVPSLLQAIADKTMRTQGRSLDTETELTVSTGATEGLFSAITALVRTGDEVILLDPAYDAYEPAIDLSGGRAVRVPLAIQDEEFVVDWQPVADAISARTRAIVLNFPHNPTGAVIGQDGLDTLAELLRDTDIYVISDEVYEHIVFDGSEHHSFLSHNELWERSIVISSFGKTFHATGWKVGYAAAPASLTTEFRKVHQFTTFAVNTPAQFALADYLESEPEFYLALSGFYQQKRDLFCELLEPSRLRLRPSRSTFFQVADYSQISDQPDVDIAERWTRDHGVATIPLSVFCETPFSGRRLRFCFAKDDDTLTRAAERLCEL